MSSISAIPSSCSCIFEKKLEPEQIRPSTQERLFWGERSAYLLLNYGLDTRCNDGDAGCLGTGLNCLVGQSFSMTQSLTLTTRFQEQTFFTFGALRKNPSLTKQVCDVRKLPLFLF
jgi:hypothetical protein